MGRLGSQAVRLIMMVVWHGRMAFVGPSSRAFLVVGFPWPHHSWFVIGLSPCRVRAPHPECTCASVHHQQVCSLAEAVGVGVHFNTLVPLDAQVGVRHVHVHILMVTAFKRSIFWRCIWR